MMTKVGIIGGSGLDDPELIQNPEEIEVDTKWGKPSSGLTVGRIGSREVAILARHGRKHRISPTQVNNRANIQALKDIGVSHIVATTACGSLREEIRRGDFVVVDQFIDFTRFRKNTFFDSFADGIQHAPMADPFHAKLRAILTGVARELGFGTHAGGTVVTIEGPRFSTVAESHMFRAWGADVVNMSTAPEVILANEAEIPYAAIAMSTDYDCWKEDEKPVSWQDVLAVFHKNADNVKRILLDAVGRI